MTKELQDDIKADEIKYKNVIENLKKENEKALAEYMKWQKQELEQKNKIID